MEPEFNKINEQPIIREQKKHNNSLWYILVALLIFALIGWYGYTAGWFSSRAVTPTAITPVTTSEPFPIEQGNGIGNGALPIGIASLDSVTINTLETFPVQQEVVISGNLNDGCSYLDSAQQQRDGNIFYISLQTRIEGEVCTQALVPFTEYITLDVNGLPAGVYIVNVNGVETSFELESDNQLDFNAGEGK